MPKLKTHKGAKKRFKKHKNKIMRMKAYHSHLATKKTKKRKRQLKKGTSVSKAEEKKIKTLLPY